MFDARAVLGIVLYFKEKVLKPLRKDEYLNRCDVPYRVEITDFVISAHFLFVDAPLWRGIILCRLPGNVFYCNTSAELRRVVEIDSAFGLFQVSHKALINRNPLGTVFASPLRFIHLAFFGAA